MEFVFATWLPVDLGVTRFAHLQRSTLKVDADFASGVATTGKSKLMGRSVPLPWSASLPGSHVTSLDTLLRWLRLDRWTRQSLSSCLTLTSVGAPCPSRWSSKRYHSLSRRLFASPQVGWPAAQAELVTSCATRRVLTTAGDVLGLRATDRVAIGGWKARPSSRCVSATAHKLKMPPRYSGERLATIQLTLVDADVSWDDLAHKRSAIVGKRRFFQDPPLSPTLAASSSAPVPPEPIDDRHDQLRLFRGRSWFHVASQSVFAPKCLRRFILVEKVGTEVANIATRVFTPFSTWICTVVAYMLRE